MAVNKVDLADGSTLIDITDTTAEAGDVVSGKTFYAANGVKTAGSASIPQPATAVPLEDNAEPTAGTSLKYAREDHRHPTDPFLEEWCDNLEIAIQEVSESVPSSSPYTPSKDSASGAAGTSVLFARGDHSHPINVPTSGTPANLAATASNGSASTYARSDHVHKRPTAAEIGALPSTTVIPTKVSDLTNDAGYISDYTETDPTVPSWAKASTKPSYTKSEVGLGNVANVLQYSASNPPPYPVTSVNGQTGAVTLDADDVGALPDTTTPADIGALTSGDFVIEQVSQAQVTIAGNSNNSGSISCAKTGYTPLALVGFTTNQTTVAIIRADIVGTSVYFNMRNLTSSSVKCNFSARVLYIKNA